MLLIEMVKNLGIVKKTQKIIRYAPSKSIIIAVRVHAHTSENWSFLLLSSTIAVLEVRICG